MNGRAPCRADPAASEALPSVSVIVPIKNSAATIAENVAALLAQDYEGPVEIILVGDVDDPSWRQIAGYIARNEVITIEAQVQSAGRDANAKRNIGLRHAHGEILGMTDSDMVMPPDWVRTGVALLQSGWHCVGGEMRSANAGFWNRYIDTNPVATKTPRMDPPYEVARGSGGAGRRKLPVTANAFFTREVMNSVGGFDEEFVWSYEDYDFFERVVRAGYPILCTSELTGRHHHRQGIKRLLREYRRSGRGCAQFIAKYPDSHFARRRLMQMGALPLLPATLLPLPHQWLVVCAALLALAGLSAMRTRHVAGVLFPFLTLALGTAFAAGLLHGLFGSARRAGRPFALSARIFSQDHEPQDEPVRS